MSAAPATIYLARVSTRDEVVAVDTDPERAVMLACRLALKYLQLDAESSGGTPHFCRTVAQVREFFAVRAVPLTVGEAAYIDYL